MSAATRLAALPAEASADDVEVDPRLPFLDAYVQRALENGAAPYIYGGCWIWHVRVKPFLP